MIIFNRDYSPFSVYREKLIHNFSKKYKINVMMFDDKLLYPINHILSSSQTNYMKFTPFYNKSLLLKPKKTINYKYNFNKFILVKTKYNYIIPVIMVNNTSPIYIIKKNDIVSPYIRFGIYSVRDIYYKYHSKRRGLLWRDFYYNIIYNNPRLINQYDDKKIWIDNKSYHKAFIDGKTGYDIIDYAVNLLKSTGFIDNRLRMIIASFYCKNLLLNWKNGMIWMGSYLIDHDYTLNLCNWLWITGLAPFSQPYFRIINPITQQKKYYRNIPSTSYDKIIDIQASVTKYLNFMKNV
jgi:deoxyribodipyrimidine photo-lyase